MAEPAGRPPPDVSWIKMSDGGVAPVAERVAAAINEGARSWAAVARVAGCSRTWARAVAAAHGLDLMDAGCRDVRLSVRVRRSAAELLDAEATRDGLPQSEMHRRLLSEALRARIERRR